MLEKFLSKLGASTKVTVGVSISPNIGLEMIMVDQSTGIVSKYACKPLEYNSSTREIANYDEFKASLEELFNELDIPTKSNIVLSVPNIYFGLMTLPLLLTDDAITNALISEVEQSYIFKRNDPVISWADVSIKNSSSDNRPLVYTAIQKPVLEKIIEVCEDVGCTVICIENSYTSLLRTLDYLNITKEQMQENISWNLMIIMQNNYSILSMSGKKILDYYEEPLALKSFIDDEIYNAIKTSAQLTLAGLPANYLFIVSETDLVSSEVLSMKLPFDGTVNFLECNKFIQNEIMPASLEILPNLAQLITPEAIGTAIYSTNSPLNLNLLGQLPEELMSLDNVESYPKINIGHTEVELTPIFVKKCIMILAIILLIPTVGAFLGINNYILPKEQTESQALDTKITQLNADIKYLQDKNKGPAFDVFEKITDIVTTNKTKLIYYSALGVSTPPQLWVSYYAADSAGKVDIQGSSTNVRNIYTFYKNLKLFVNDSDIQLKKLELASNSMDALIHDDIGSKKVYNFEIANMDDSAIAGSMPEPNGQPTDNNNQQNPANQAPSPQPNQPSGPQPNQPPSPDQKQTQNQPSAHSGLSPYTPGQPFFNLRSADTTGQGNTNNQNQPSGNQPQDPNLPRNLRKIEKF